MDMPKETRDRIYNAANKLYEEAGRAAFPTVDVVRKMAKVNMNDASAVMKEWRHAQTAQAVPVAVLIPDAIQAAANASLSVLWQKAVDLANESLRAAQAGWEVERLEADALSIELGNAYDTQSDELTKSLEENERLRQEISGLMLAKAAIESRTVEVERQLSAANAGTDRAEARAIEIELRAQELRTELNHAHSESAELRLELADVRRATAADMEVMRGAHRTMQEKFEAAAEKTANLLDLARSELVSTKGKAEAVQAELNMAKDALRVAKQAEQNYREQSEQAQRSEASVREKSAKLNGQLEALAEQNAHLLILLKKDGESQGKKSVNITENSPKNG